jgi:hypothetical protein
MIGNVTLTIPRKVERGKVFQAVVSITAAVPGDDVTVTLKQQSGTAGSLDHDLTTRVTADGEGNAIAFFDVTLTLPGRVELSPLAEDSQGPHFDSHSRSTVVV